MTQVSRNPLPHYLEQQMHKAIRKAFADLRTEEDVAAFLNDLLTPTEKVMIGKRLAIAILLDRGYDQRTIHTIMKTSLATVNSVNFWLKHRGNGYRIVLTKLKNQKEWQEFKEGLDEFLKKFFTARGQYEMISKIVPTMPKEVTPRDDIL
jgi:uncharacterized protein YerC